MPVAKPYSDAPPLIVTLSTNSNFTASTTRKDDLSLMKEKARKRVDEKFSSKYLIAEHMKLINSK